LLKGFRRLKELKLLKRGRCLANTLVGCVRAYLHLWAKRVEVKNLLEEIKTGEY